MEHTEEHYIQRRIESAKASNPLADFIADLHDKRERGWQSPATEAIGWRAESVVQAERTRELWLLVEHIHGHEMHAGISLVDAVAIVRTETIKGLLGYSQDTSSGRFHNDVARAKADADRDWLRATEL